MAKPIPGREYMCKLRHCFSGEERSELLMAVDEDDVDWRTVDDNSELSYNWDVVEKRLIAKKRRKSKQERNDG